MGRWVILQRPPRREGGARTAEEEMWRGDVSRLEQLWQDESLNRLTSGCGQRGPADPAGLKVAAAGFETESSGTAHWTGFVDWRWPPEGRNASYERSMKNGRISGVSRSGRRAFLFVSRGLNADYIAGRLLNACHHEVGGGGSSRRTRLTDQKGPADRPRLGMSHA